MSSLEGEKPMPSHAEKVGSSEKVNDAELVDDVDFVFTWRVISILIAALVAYLANIIQLCITGVYLFSIGLGLKDTSTIAWIPEAGQVILAVTAPPVALASDLYGRKIPCVVGLLLGWVGSLVSTTANTMPVCIAGCVIAGFAFAGQPLFSAIVSEVLPRRYRPMAQGAVFFLVGLAGVIGVYVGGPFIENDVFGAGWRMIFGMCAILYFIAFVLFVVLYRPMHARPVSSKNISHHDRFMKVGKQLDWIGTFLIAAGLLPLLMGLTWLNNPYPVSDPHCFAPITIGSIFFVIFVLYEWKGRDDGLIHHKLFSKTRNYALCCWLLFVEGSVVFGFSIYWPQQFQLVYGGTPFGTGIRTSSFYFAIMLGVPILSYLSQKFKNWELAKWFTTAGYVVFLVAVICMITLEPGQSGRAIAYCAIAGLAASAPLTLLVVIAQLSVPGELLGLATANLLMARAIGGAVGVAAFSAIFNSKLTVKLPEYVAGATLPLGLAPTSLGPLIGALASGSVAAAEAVPGVTLEIIQAAGAAITQAYSDSFRYLWILNVAFTVLAIIACFFLEPTRQFMDRHVDAPAGKDDHDIKTGPSA